MYAVRSGAFRASDGSLAAPGPQAEDLLLKQWLECRSHDLISDYDAQEDEIVLVYEAKHHPKPLVSLDLSEAPLWAKVLIDGEEIAKVNLPLTLADIRLLPI